MQECLNEQFAGTGSLQFREYADGGEQPGIPSRHDIPLILFWFPACAGMTIFTLYAKMNSRVTDKTASPSMTICPC